MPVQECKKDGVAGWNTVDLAWAAGLLEGEGCFHSTQNRPRITVNMTDEDVLLRLQAVLGVGRVSGPGNYGFKPVWRFDINKLDHVYAVTAAVYGWLGARRKIQARKLIALYTSKTPRGYKVELRCEECGVAFYRAKKAVRTLRVYCSTICGGKAVGRLRPCPS